jgi:hypothetical protein
MNSTQRNAIEEAIKGVYPAGVPLHRFESILGLKGTLTDLERACDPENGTAYQDTDFAEWEGKKGLQLWCLLESYQDYERTQLPADPSAYLKAKIVNKSPKLKVSGAEAKLISEFFIFINKALDDWEKVKVKKSGSRQSTPKLPAQQSSDLGDKNEISPLESVEGKLPMQNVKEATLSDAVSNIFQLVAIEADKHVTSMFARFTDRLIDKVEKKEEITRDLIVQLSATVSGVTVFKIEAALAKVKKSEKIELKNAKQRLERAKGPFCGYKFGKKSENSGKTCGDFCVDATLYPNKEGEMITLCVKHVKTAATKHTCQFPDKNKNECGKRVPDEETEPYSRKGEWKGLSYCGLWICGQHKPIADKNLDKASHPCTKTNTKGKKCERVAQKNEDGTWSSQCTSCNKRDQKKISKKAADQRKALKKGKKEKKGKGKKAEKDEVVVSEVKEEKSDAVEKKTDEKKETKDSKKAPVVSKSGSKKKPSKDEESDSESESEDESDSESESEDEDDKPKKKATKSSKKPSDDSESDSEDEKESSDAKSTTPAEEKLTVNVSLDVKKFKDADWTVRRMENEAKEKFNCFVDANSGLVCYNAEDGNAQEVTNANLTALGVWNNEKQLYVELSKAAIKYANKLGVKVAK